MDFEERLCDMDGFLSENQSFLESFDQDSAIGQSILSDSIVTNADHSLDTNIKATKFEPLPHPELTFSENGINYTYLTLITELLNMKPLQNETLKQYSLRVMCLSKKRSLEQ